MYTAAHQLVTIIGDSFNSAEKWQFGLRITSGGVSNQATADAIKPVVTKWWIGTAAPYVTGNSFRPCNTHRLTEIKVANIDVDGTYPPTLPSASSFVLPALVGTGSSAGQPAQATMVATLTTALPRGLASKGRIYLPHCVYQSPDSTGLIPIINAQSLADSVRILINEINAETLVGNVQIFSRGRGVPAYDSTRHRVTYTYPNAGAQQAVTGVRVGRVIDTQRRRRRSLTELPSTAAGAITP